MFHIHIVTQFSVNLHWAVNHNKHLLQKLYKWSYRHIKINVFILKVFFCKRKRCEFLSIPCILRLTHTCEHNLFWFTKQMFLSTFIAKYQILVTNNMCDDHRVRIQCVSQFIQIVSKFMMSKSIEFTWEC